MNLPCRPVVPLHDNVDEISDVGPAGALSRAAARKGDPVGNAWAIYARAAHGEGVEVMDPDSHRRLVHDACSDPG